MFDLLSEVIQNIGPPFLGLSSKLLGVSQPKIETALNVTLLGILGRIVHKGLSPTGAADLLTLLQKPEIEPRIADHISDYLGGNDATQKLASVGDRLVMDMFGNRTGDLIGAVVTRQRAQGRVRTEIDLADNSRGLKSSQKSRFFCIALTGVPCAN